MSFATVPARPTRTFLFGNFSCRDLAVSSHVSPTFVNVVSIAVHIAIICVAALDVHWELISLILFASLQLFYFALNTNVYVPYPSLGIAYVIIIWQKRVLAIVLPSIGLLLFVSSWGASHFVERIQNRYGGKPYTARGAL